MLLNCNKHRCGESKKSKGAKKANLPRLELLQNGAHHFVAHKRQGRNSKGCARSPFDGCCPQLLTLQVGGEMMSKGPFKRFAKEQCSRQSTTKVAPDRGARVTGCYTPHGHAVHLASPPSTNTARTS